MAALRRQSEPRKRLPPYAEYRRQCACTTANDDFLSTFVCKKTERFVAAQMSCGVVATTSKQ